MSTIELKQILKEQISNIDDISFLEALKIILASKVSESIYELDDFQKERVVLARQELKDGLTISHQELQNEINQWLNGK